MPIINSPLPTSWSTPTFTKCPGAIHGRSLPMGNYTTPQSIGTIQSICHYSSDSKTWRLQPHPWTLLWPFQESQGYRIIIYSRLSSGTTSNKYELIPGTWWTIPQAKIALMSISWLLSSKMEETRNTNSTKYWNKSLHVCSDRLLIWAQMLIL